MKKQAVSIALLATLLIQSCVVYQHTTVSIDEAHNKGKVKVKSNRGISYEFSNIEIRDSIYYGVSKKGDIPLKTALIASIYLQDIDKSKTKTIIAAVGASIAGILGLLIISSLIVANAIDSI